MDVFMFKWFIVERTDPSRCAQAQGTLTEGDVTEVELMEVEV